MCELACIKIARVMLYFLLSGISYWDDKEASVLRLGYVCSLVVSNFLLIICCRINKYQRVYYGE